MLSSHSAHSRSNASDFLMPFLRIESFNLSLLIGPIDFFAANFETIFSLETVPLFDDGQPLISTFARTLSNNLQ